MKTSGKELLWMVVPVIGLGAIGYLLRFRKPATVVVTGPFTMHVKGWKFLPVRPIDVWYGHDTRIEVEIGATGKKPEWWEDGLGKSRGMLDGQLVAVGTTNGKLTPLSRDVFRTSPARQEDGRWITEYRLNRGKVAGKSGVQVRLQDTIDFEDGPTRVSKGLWLDIPVLKSGEKVARPVVSTDPKLGVISFQVKRESHVIYMSKKGRVGKESFKLDFEFALRGDSGTSKSIKWIDKLKIQDSWGKTVPLGGAWAYGERQNPPRQIRSYGYEHKPGTLVPPLTLVGDIGWNENWPRPVKFPFLDAEANIVVDSRTPPGFRVLGWEVERSDPLTSDRREDTTVIVKFAPLRPAGGDTLNWEGWSVKLNPRIVDSQGKIYRQFDYKEGKEPIQVDLGGSILNGKNENLYARYPLVLRDIPKSAGKLIFKNELSYKWCKPIPVSVVVRQ